MSPASSAAKPKRKKPVEEEEPEPLAAPASGICRGEGRPGRPGVPPPCIDSGAVEALAALAESGAPAIAGMSGEVDATLPIILAMRWTVTVIAGANARGVRGEANRPRSLGCWGEAGGFGARTEATAGTWTSGAAALTGSLTGAGSDSVTALGVAAFEASEIESVAAVWTDETEIAGGFGT
jgi:hypothetical protein